MTVVAYLDPRHWIAVTTTEDVLISGTCFELAFAAAKPAITDEGHGVRGSRVIPAGSKAWVRGGGLEGQKVKASSLGATAVAPINPLRFTTIWQHHVTLGTELDGTATGGTAPLTYVWRTADDQPIAGQTTSKYTPTVAGRYTVEVTDADGVQLVAWADVTAA